MNTHSRNHGRDTRPRGISLNADQARQLLAAIDRRSPWGPRNFAFVIFLFHTGLRVSELVSLNAGHVATSKGAPRQFLHLPAAGAKGGQSRVVPLNATAQKAVAALLAFNRTRGFSVAQDAPLFVNRYHKRLPVRTVQFIFQHLRERADLDVRATPHTARHTFGTQAVLKTGDVRATQKILGHHNITSTAIYLHPTAQGMARVTDSLVR